MSGLLMIGVLVLLGASEPSVLHLGPTPPARIERVVTVAPSLTQTILKLGAGEVLVGVSRFDDAPEVKTLPRVGGFIDPSVEAIFALKPHLLVAQKAPGNRGAIEKLASMGVSTLALPLVTIQDVIDAIGELGRSLHREERAKELIQQIREARQQVRQLARQQKRQPTVMIVYGFKPLVVAGPGSFAAELLADTGATNVAHKATSAYPAYSLERAVALKPDVIIDCSDANEGREETMKLLSASRWVRPNSRALLQPSPELAEGLWELQRAVNPKE